MKGRRATEHDDAVSDEVDVEPVYSPPSSLHDLPLDGLPDVGSRSVRKSLV
jgi:hypothetical protein